MAMLSKVGTLSTNETSARHSLLRNDESNTDSFNLKINLWQEDARRYGFLPAH